MKPADEIYKAKLSIGGPDRPSQAKVAIQRKKSLRVRLATFYLFSCQIYASLLYLF